MSGKWMRNTTRIGFVFILVTAVSAGEHELRYEVLDMAREGLYVTGQFLRPATKSEEKLSAEPAYGSEAPIYLTAQLGSGVDRKYAIVLDKSKPADRGYDVLYADRNNNENLTDDPKIGQRDRHQEDSYVTGTLGPVEVMIDYGDLVAPYYFSVRYHCFGEQGMPLEGGGVANMSVEMQPAGYYTGVVSFGESRRRIAVVDFNGNGLYNDYFKADPRVRAPEGRLYAIGDQILIDVNGDGRFDRGYRDNKELYPCAKYIQVGGVWYSLDIAAHGGKVDVRTPALKFGTMEIPSHLGSCSLQLVSENGTMRFDEAQKEIQVPTGTYQLYAYTADATHSSGRWRFEAQGTTSGEELQVGEDDHLPLRFGPPLLVNVSSYTIRGAGGRQPGAGDTIDLSLTLSGQGGEIYTSIEKNGDSPPEPVFRIVDEKGKALVKGAFEYG